MSVLDYLLHAHVEFRKHFAGSVEDQIVHQPDLGMSMKSILPFWENNKLHARMHYMN